jgi:transposase-like protein
VVKENNQTDLKSSPIFDELESFVRAQIQAKLQAVLDEEVDQFLGRIKHERKSGKDARDPA